MSALATPTSYGYLPGPENICRSCNGFLRWPDGKRWKCECAEPNPFPQSPDHRYWKTVPYHDKEGKS